MKFPTLKPAKTNDLSVQALRGGVNLRDGNGTADRHLQAVGNMWWYNGALRTRPAFSVREEYAIAKETAEVTWKFCNEDTSRGKDSGRRFLRRSLDVQTQTVTLQVGILTYDGRFVYEGKKAYLPADTTGMIMEYPYTAEENVLIFLSDGSIYAQNNDGDWRQVNNETYVPCVLVGGEGVRTLSEKPIVPGTPYEARNMLSGKFAAKYTTTGIGIVFHMPYDRLDEKEPVTISITYLEGGVVEYVIPAYTDTCDYGKNGLKPIVNREKGIFYFMGEAGSLTPPMEGFPNNMTVTAYKEWTATEKQIVPSMSLCTWLGGSQTGSDSRQFIGGSSVVGNRIYWSGQGQPLYFPETNYVSVGDINQSITAFGKQDGMLVIFKEREIYSLSKPQGTVSAKKLDGQLVQTVTASDYFPLTQLHGQVGCMAPQTVVLCGNRLCWADGMGGVYTLIGHTVRELSALLGGILKGYSEQQWRTANAALYEGHYLLQVTDTVYVLRVDEKAFRQYANEYSDSQAQQSLAWYIWHLPSSYKIDFLYGNGTAVSALTHRLDYATQTVYELPLYIHDGTDNRHSTAYEDYRNISVFFKTKEYAFGMPYARKRLLRVYLGLATEDTARMWFAYLRDGEEIEETYSIFDNSKSDVVLTPNLARMRSGGLMVTGEGKIAVDSLTFTYR